MAVAEMEQTQLVLAPDTGDIKESSPLIVQEAQSLVVSNAQEYSFAGEILKKIKAFRSKITERFAEPKRKAHEAHKAITAMEKGFLDGPAEAERIVSTKMNQWRIEEDRKARLEEQRILEERRKAAEAERKAQADALRKDGDKVAAREVLKAPIVVEAPVVQPVIPKVEGLTTRKTWKYRIVDASLIPREYMAIDETKISGVVRAFKGDTKIPGVEVYEETSVVGRAF